MAWLKETKSAPLMQLSTLQVGRGIAAIAVAAFHLSILLDLPRYLGRPIFYDLTRRGNLGVDFFFVLSGFVIIFAHIDDIGRPARIRMYIFKRFGRLFPIYWIYTAIFFVLINIGFGNYSNTPNSLQNWISTIFLVRLDNFEMPITPAWSLVHELAFYFVFALIILNRWCGAAVLLAWLLIGVVIFLYAEEGARQPLTTYFSPLNINFLFGIVAFYAWRRFDASYLKYAFPLGLLLFSIIYSLERQGLPYQCTQIPYALDFGLLIAGAAAWESSKNIKIRVPLLGFIGEASYSIYLTHLAFLGFYAKIFIKLFGVDGGYSGQFVYLASLVMTVASGSFLYLTVESPLLRAYRRGLGSRSA